MRTVHFGLRVSDLDSSLAFYRALGYEVIGTVPETAFGSLTMIKLPGEEFVAIELVHDPGNDPAGFGNGLNHFVVSVEDIAATVEDLAGKGIDVDGYEPTDDPRAMRTAWVTDPDGYRIELVQWPDGHADGLSAADWVN
jgi:lactoylglutathione lyase